MKEVPSPLENHILSNRLEREGNIVRLYKDGNVYTIIYTYHLKQESPEMIPKETTALFLEGYSMKPPEEGVFSSAFSYQKLQPSLEKKQIPIYLPDLGFSGLGLSASFGSAMLLLVTEAFIGFEMGRRILWEKPISRRDFFKIGAGGLAALWLLAPLPIGVGTTIPLVLNKGVGRALELDKLSHQMHPELDFLGLALRNVVIAHKEEWVAGNLAKENQNLVTIIGAGHVGIEDAFLCSPEKRLQFLRRLRPLLKAAVIPETLYTMPKFTYEGNHWQKEIFEIPELKELILNG